jgi:ABC-type transport system involved in cytochrome c biogenesis permease subunit
LENSLKEAEKSIIEQALKMQSEKVKVGIIGTAVGLVAGSATVGIIWLLKMN